jgi:formate dehydrogenase subunit delta
MSEGNKLVRMANQIATFFHSQPASEAADGVATHINKFWEPRMRRQLFDLVDNHGDEGLDGLVLQAVPLIRRPPPAELSDAQANAAH